jgi:hypothetical protein
MQNSQVQFHLTTEMESYLVKYQREGKGKGKMREDADIGKHTGLTWMIRFRSYSQNRTYTKPNLSWI